MLQHLLEAVEEREEARLLIPRPMIAHAPDQFGHVLVPLRTELESSRIRAVVNGELADPCEPDSLSGRGLVIVGPVNRARVQSL